jgi:hypothetical protein
MNVISSIPICQNYNKEKAGSMKCKCNLNASHVPLITILRMKSKDYI